MAHKQRSNIKSRWRWLYEHRWVVTAYSKKINLFNHVDGGALVLHMHLQDKDGVSLVREDSRYV